MTSHNNVKTQKKLLLRFIYLCVFIYFYTAQLTPVNGRWRHQVTSSMLWFIVMFWNIWNNIFVNNVAHLQIWVNLHTKIYNDLVTRRTMFIKYRDFKCSFFMSWEMRECSEKNTNNVFFVPLLLNIFPHWDFSWHFSCFDAIQRYVRRNSGSIGNRTQLIWSILLVVQ